MKVCRYSTTHKRYVYNHTVTYVLHEGDRPIRAALCTGPVVFKAAGKSVHTDKLGRHVVAGEGQFLDAHSLKQALEQECPPTLIGAQSVLSAIDDPIRDLKRAVAKRNTFRRNCRCTEELGKKKKAWRVPGTPEAGTDAMLTQAIADAVCRARNNKAFISRA